MTTLSDGMIGTLKCSPAQPLCERENLSILTVPLSLALQTQQTSPRKGTSLPVHSGIQN